MSERVAIITGAAGGIGQALTRGLVNSGLRVLAVDRATDGIPEGATALAADLSDPGQAAGVVAQALERFGRLDILVNNAGIGMGSIRPDHWRKPIDFWEVSPEQYQRFVAINAVAPFVIARTAIPHMLKEKWGRIVNVTTSLGTMVRRGYIAYGSSKAALEAQTAVMAADLDGTGVTANVLVPGGATDTAMVPPESGFAREKLLKPEVMVPPLLHLLSDAGGAINGRRFLAVHWDTSLAPEEAAAKAGAPAAWQALAVLPIVPKD
jgi:NAD(P)-dependent dehydrogenase (short-subunit alcohol dehydrogenase family)